MRLMGLRNDLEKLKQMAKFIKAYSELEHRLNSDPEIIAEYGYVSLLDIHPDILTNIEKSNYLMKDTIEKNQAADERKADMENEVAKKAQEILRPKMQEIETMKDILFEQAKGIAHKKRVITGWRTESGRTYNWTLPELEGYIKGEVMKIARETGLEEDEARTLFMQWNNTSIDKLKRAYTSMYNLTDLTNFDRKALRSIKSIIKVRMHDWDSLEKETYALTIKDADSEMKYPIYANADERRERINFLDDLPPDQQALMTNMVRNKELQKALFTVMQAYEKEPKKVEKMVSKLEK